jgi:hypothetical protein
MESIDSLRRRLADLVPGQANRIGQTRSMRQLLRIAIEHLEVRSDMLASTGFGLGQKVGTELHRQKRAAKGKAEHKRDVDLALIGKFETAYQGFLSHREVKKSASPQREAKRMAWQYTQQEFEKIVGRSIKLESLKKRLRPYRRL